MNYLLQKYNDFNEWLAEIAAKILSSMEFFYLCVALDLFELPPRDCPAQRYCVVYLPLKRSIPVACPSLACPSVKDRQRPSRES